MTDRPTLTRNGKAWRTNEDSRLFAQYPLTGFAPSENDPEFIAFCEGTLKRTAHGVYEHWRRAAEAAGSRLSDTPPLCRERMTQRRAAEKAAAMKADAETPAPATAAENDNKLHWAIRELVDAAVATEDCERRKTLAIVRAALLDLVITIDDVIGKEGGA